MELNSCLTILKERGNIKACTHPNFIPPPRQSTITTNLSYKDESNLKLLQFIITLQRERIENYTIFSSVTQQLIDQNSLTEFPSLVAEMTSRFSVISQHIIAIKVFLLQYTIQ